MTPEVCLFAVKENGLLLKRIPKKLHSKEICLEAVKENGLALKYVSRKIIDNTIWIAAIQSNGVSIKYVPEKLRSIKMYNEAVRQNGFSLKYFPEKAITKTRAIKAIRQNGLALKYIPAKIIIKEMFELAIELNGLSLEFVPGRNKTKKLCVSAVENNSLALEFVPNRFKKDDMLNTALKRTWKAYRYFPEKKYTLSNCNHFLNEMIKFKKKEGSLKDSDYLFLMKIVEKFPDKINTNIDIITIERLLKVRKISLMCYDAENELFRVEEKLLFNDTEILEVFYSFDDFYNYLDGDLREADLYDFDFLGIDLKNYNVDGAYIRSSMLIKNCMYNSNYYENIIGSSISYLDDMYSRVNEKIEGLQNIQVPKLENINFSDYTRKFYYISDIHLDHKLRDKFPQHATRLEIIEFIESIVNSIVDNIEGRSFYDYLLIAGDVSFNIEISRIFYSILTRKKLIDNIVVVLGNHELWQYASNKFNIDEITNEYRQLFDELDVKFLQNDLLIIGEYNNKIIRENELAEMTDESLKYELLNSSTAVLGGLGFSGYNTEYNAIKGIYRDVISSIEDDIQQTERFEALYSRLKKMGKDKDIIILTHTPKNNWSKDQYNSNWYYVNGHTHTNVFCKDASRTIYADNQVGYYNKYFELKNFEISRAYDIFKYYSDGRYTITKNQYKDFNRGMGIQMNFNQVFDKIHMLKKEGIYCFLLENRGILYFLEGGRKHSISNDSIDYYYKNMTQYSCALKESIAKYNSTLKKIAQEIRRFGGSGNIHGSIIDIDFYNHIYLNPIDGSVVPYYATSIVNKYVYRNVSELLLSHQKDLYKKYLVLSKDERKEEFSINQQTLTIHDDSKLVQETDIYQPSNLIKSIQYLTNSNVIRKWNYNVISKEKNLPVKRKSPCLYN